MERDTGQAAFGRRKNEIGDGQVTGQDVIVIGVAYGHETEKGQVKQLVDADENGKGGYGRHQIIGKSIQSGFFFLFRHADFLFMHCKGFRPCV